MQKPDLSRNGMILVTYKPEKTLLMNNRILCGLIILTLSFIACKKDDDNTPSTPATIKDSILVSGLQFPWEILWGPDNHIWMTERDGEISRINPTTGVVTPVFTITEVEPDGEGGLLGMVLHPNFASSPHVFVVYNYDDGPVYKEKVVRFTYNGTTLTSPLTIIDDIAAAGIHNGSRLVITPDLKLFITTGDANNTALPQDIAARNGKVLRLNLDGSIPADNPVASSPIWSSGHRNPQGLVYANNMLYSSEHGADTDDEINIIEKSRNYGWPTVRGLCNAGAEQTFCSANNVKESISEWTPTIAVTGMDYYNSDSIPQWKNSLLVATLKNTRLMQLKLNASNNDIEESNEFLTGKYGRMRDLCVSPAGRVYICTSNGGNNDRIIQVKRQ
jgi:glucose/arabinose dehydrogenase